MSDRIDEVASTVFGLDRLRAGQRPAVEALLDGHDVLLVQPTGAGKSLAYQLAAVLIDGPTVVVSPLLALQQDQTDHLAAFGGRTQARRVSSAETPRQREEALEEARRGEVEFLFLAPEQLANEAVHAAVTAMRPSLVAVDEAHCVSSWGHDFRPDYLRLGELLGGLEARIIAMTATASPPVRAD
ncbi:MAG: DEAD/DEAH box helicase, partial [Janthinobacterium lividum]